MESIKKFLGFKGDNDGSSLGFSDHKSVEIDSKPLANTTADGIPSADTNMNTEPAADTRTDTEPSADKNSFAETKAFAKKMNKHLDVWLEENFPMHMHEHSTSSPTKKLIKSLTCVGCMVYIAAYYRKDIAAMPTKKLRRRYRRLSAALIVGFSFVLYCTYFQAGIFKPVTVQREPGDTDADVLYKGMKKRLTPEKGSLMDRYIVSNIPSFEFLTKLVQKRDQDSKTSNK